MAIRGDPDHPGLKNLVSIKDSEMADEWRKRGLEVRKKNKEKRELAKQTIVAMKELGDEAPDAMAALNFVLVQAMEEGDTDQIIKVASILAEYQQPKLSRQDVTQTNLDASDLTDAELEEELSKLTLQ
jgi:hypothetical protein